jgi:hypothetical protein
MPFWNNTAVEPKRAFRWILYLPAVTGDAESSAPTTYAIRDVNKPSFQITSTAVNFMIHTFKYPGRATWNDVNVTLIDPINPDMSGILARIVQASGYRKPETEQDARFSFAKASAVNSLGKPRIQQIDAGGNPDKEGRIIPPRIIEEWSLANAWVSNVEFGSLNYTSEDLVQLKLTISYDYAEFAGNFDPATGKIKSIL